MSVGDERHDSHEPDRGLPIVEVGKTALQRTHGRFEIRSGHAVEGTRVHLLDHLDEEVEVGPPILRTHRGGCLF